MEDKKEIMLTEGQSALVNQYKDQVDFKDSSSIVSFGAEAQKKISDFSNTALQGVKTKNLGEVSIMLTNLVTELKGFDASADDTGFLGFFKKKANSIEKLKAKYDTAENNVEKVAAALEAHQDQLTKDVVLLDELYEANQEYFNNLSMYIIAGKEKLELARNVELLEYQKKAEESGLVEDAQFASDFADLCNRFEKRISDLELTRAISLQMAPQIRLIQNSNNLLIEKIQTTINNTIPLWKNQMIITLGLAHSKEAVDAQRSVNNVTNELLKKNAEALHQGTVAIATESERGIVDIETLVKTNEELVNTIDDVLNIQQEGHKKRVEAEAELNRIEGELRAKLVEVVNKKKGDINNEKQ